MEVLAALVLAYLVTKALSGGKPARTLAGSDRTTAPAVKQRALPAPGSQMGRPTLRVGSKGSAVLEWQTFVRTAGHDPGPLDGVFGRKTKEATSAYQKSKGLAPDGIVGPKTWASTTAGGEGAFTAEDIATFRTKPTEPAAASALTLNVEPPRAQKGIEAKWNELAQRLAGGGAAPDVTAVLSSYPESGREFLASVPAELTDAREEQILKALIAGLVTPHSFTPVVSEKGGKRLTFYAMNDAVLLGLTDGVRVNLRHTTAQVLADMTGMVLPTSRMSDLAYQQAAIRIRPQVLSASRGTAGMSKTSWMVDHSAAVSAALAKAGGKTGAAQLVRTVGKDWVTTERLLTPSGAIAGPSRKGDPTPRSSTEAGAIAAANFGWHSSDGPSRSPGGSQVWQSIGLAHDIGHTDYSQVVTLYAGYVTIEGGAERSVEEVLHDPALAFLLSDEVTEGKACRVARHPSVTRGGIA